MENNLVSLESLEAIIEKGLQSFIQVGEALSLIRDNRLWEPKYTSFDTYCRERWQFGQANASWYITNAQTAKALPTPPVRASHVHPLKKIQDEALRQKAWAEVLWRKGDPEQVTASDVKIVTAKYRLVEMGGRLGTAVENEDLTVRDAVAIHNQLEKLPAPYRDAVEKWGIVSPQILQKLQQIQFQFPEEVESIFNCGYLYLNDDAVAFAEINLGHLEVLHRRLRYEATQSKVQTAIEAQKTYGIYDDGFEPDDLVAVFPQLVTADQLTNMLHNAGYKIFMLLAYKDSNLEIKFNSKIKTPISQVNGVKPQPIIDLMTELVS